MTSRVSNYFSSLSFTVMAEKKKKPGEENILSKKELIVLILCSGSRPTTMQLTREGPVEYDEILLENIEETCTQNFFKKQNCNVLISEQIPLCTCLDQLSSLNLIFIHYATPASIKYNESTSELWTLPPPMKKAKSFENKAIDKKIFHSQKFSWLLWLNPRVRREYLTRQLSWVAAWLLVTRVCPVYLVKEHCYFGDVYLSLGGRWVGKGRRAVSWEGEKVVLVEWGGKVGKVGE